MSSNTSEVRSAVSAIAMDWGMNPAIIINPAATPEDLIAWAVADLKNLYSWLNVLACCKSDVEMDLGEFSGLITERLEPLIQGFDAALQSGRV
jgi:hypothetical protein